eukprot:scaffold116950_cov22-Cyclotella_meneghiniana.AAC.2
MPKTVSLIILLRLRHRTRALEASWFRNSNRHKSNRQLIPDRPMLPQKKGHHSSSAGHHGCLGLSDDAVLSSAADYFGDNVPPCAIYVNDTLVAGSGGSSYSSNDDDSSSGSSGSGSSSSSTGSGSGSAGSGSGGWWSWLGGGDSSSSSNSNGSGGNDNGNEGDNNERNNNDDA